MDKDDKLYGKIKDSFNEANNSVPKDLWSNLSGSLDSSKSDNVLDDKVRKSFNSDFNPKAPEQVWGNVNRQLNIDRVWNRINNQLDRRPIFYWFRLAGVAALFLISIATGLTLFQSLRSNKSINTIEGNNSNSNNVVAIPKTVIESGETVFEDKQEEKQNTLFDTLQYTIKETGNITLLERVITSNSNKSDVLFSSKLHSNENHIINKGFENDTIKSESADNTVAINQKSSGKNDVAINNITEVVNSGKIYQNYSINTSNINNEQQSINFENNVFNNTKTSNNDFTSINLSDDIDSTRKVEIKNPSNNLHNRQNSISQLDLYNSPVISIDSIDSIIDSISIKQEEPVMYSCAIPDSNSSKEDWKKQRFEVGIMYSFNNTQLNNNETTLSKERSSLISSTASFTQNIGIHGAYNLSRNSSLAMQVHINSSLKQKYGIYLKGNYYTKVVDLDYNKLGLQYEKRITKNSGKIFFRTGIYLAKLRHADWTYNNIEIHPEDRYTNVDYGLKFGVGKESKIWNSLTLEYGLNIDYGVRNIYKGDNRIDPGFDVTKNRQIGLYFLLKYNL